MEYRVHTISWNITKRCNIQCAHCYLDAAYRTGERIGELSTEECFRIIDQIEEVNPHALLILTGGEPLLRKDIFEIARYASQKKFMVVIGTNGTILNDKLVQKMVAAGVKGVSISLHSVRPEAHDHFTQVPGSWQKAVRGAQVLKRNQVEFIIQTSTMSWNYDEIPRIVDFAYELGARFFNLYFLVCTGRGQGLSGKDISEARYEAMLVQVFEMQKKYQGKMLISAKCTPQYKRIVYEADPNSPYLKSYSGGCPAATHYAQITPTGEVTPCPYMSIPLGNVRKKSFAEIWHTSPLLNQLRDRKLLQGRCGSCEFKVVCSGCRARAFAETGNYLAEDPSCQYEPGKYNFVEIKLEETLTLGLEADFQLTWTDEAKKRLEMIPSFARGMVIKGVEGYARSKGYSVITPELMKEVREKAMQNMGGMFSLFKKNENNLLQIQDLKN
ncbi:MAG TPA: radical SAM protein [Candidatus Limnocylindrales bacterium]|nr:radical SAM protein [Candidatus Limnocylindrales bacterium]